MSFYVRMDSQYIIFIYVSRVWCNVLFQSILQQSSANLAIFSIYYVSMFTKRNKVIDYTNSGINLGYQGMMILSQLPAF